MSPIASVIVFVISLVAGFVPHALSKKHFSLDFLLSFCSGVMIATAFIHMLPISTQALPEKAGFYVLAGFLVIYLLERFVMIHPCQEEACVTHQIGISAFIGLAIHSVLAGISVGVVLLSSASVSTQWSVIAAITLHKIPETISLSTLLAHSEIQKKRQAQIVLAFCFATPIGILLPAFSLQHYIMEYLNILVAMSAGTFIYIASSDLLPHLHKKDAKKIPHLIVFLTGILLLTLIDFGH